MGRGCSPSRQSPLPNGCLGGAQLLLSHPLPLTLCLSQDGVMVLSATHRYKKKYVTTLLYKPI